MRISRLLHLALAGNLALLAAWPASAQDSGKVVAPPPPQLEKLDEGEPPAITIRQPTSASEITEKRSPGGQVEEIKVKSGGSTYYLKPKQATGNPPGDDISVPQWVIHEFDSTLPNKEQEKPQPQVLEPAPKK